MQTKDIQNQCCTIDNLYRLAHGFLQIGLLRGRQVVIKNNDIGIHAMHQAAKLLYFTGTDKRFGIRLYQTLRQASHALGTSRVGKALQLIERAIERPCIVAPLNTD